jgi:hypothetical protein
MASRFYRLLVKDIDNLPRYSSMAKWILRLTVVVYILAIYWRRLATLNFESDYFLIAIFYVIFSILLFIGGFQKRATMTRFSALVLVILTLVYIGASFMLHKNLYTMFTSKILLLSVCLYFATSSNWRENRRKSKLKRGTMTEEELDEEEEDDKYPMVLP